MGRNIAYLNMSHFSVEVERRLNPDYKKRPCALAPLHSDRAGIWDLSEEAISEGLFKGMPVSVAKKICPKLELIPPRPELYQQVHQKLESKIQEKFSPHTETDKHGHVYLDISSTQKVLGGVKKIACELGKDLQSHFGLPFSLGMASNKLVSRIASKCSIHEGESLIVPMGSEVNFLAPLPVQALPLAQLTGKKTSLCGSDPQRPLKQKLPGSLPGPRLLTSALLKGNVLEICSDLGLEFIKDIQSLNPLACVVAFGDLSHEIKNYSLGIDLSPVRGQEREIRLYREMYLDHDSNDLDILLNYLRRLLSDLCLETAEKGKGAFKGIELNLRYSDYRWAQGRNKWADPLNNFNQLWEKTQKVFLQAHKRRTRIRYIALNLIPYQNQFQQISLFEYDPESGLPSSTSFSDRGVHHLPSKTQGALELISRRFGKQAIFRGA